MVAHVKEMYTDWRLLSGNGRHIVELFLLVGSQTQIDDICSKTRASCLPMVRRALYSHHASTIQEKADLEQIVLKYKETGSWETPNSV